MQNKSFKKILIIAPSWIGDAVMMHSLLRYLHKQKRIELHVLASPLIASIVEGYMPEVSKVIRFTCAHGELGLKKRYRLGKMLKKQSYDQAIILPNSFKSALIPWFAKIPKRTGWRGEWRYGLLNNLRVLDKNKYPLAASRYLALGFSKCQDIPTHHFWPKFLVNPDEVKACVTRFNINPQKTIIALCPGAAYGTAKQWPAEYFAHLTVELDKRGYLVIILGSNDAKDAAKRMMQLHQSNALNLVNKTILSEVVNILSLASVVVTNDSGLMHIAAALDRHIIAIYGSSSPKYTPPLSERATILVRQLDCQPCFKRICPLKHLACLRGIKPKAVLAAIEELLQ